MNETEIYNIFNNNNLHYGRMISFSKSLYSKNHPKNIIYYNANIFTEKYGKIWYGDLDLTLDIKSLENISKELNEKLYVLREMDGRFENENLDFNEVVQKAVEVI